jgi:hypothetical protein
VAKKVASAIDRAGGDVVVSDCHRVNGGIVQEPDRTPQHPLSTLTRACGIIADLRPRRAANQRGDHGPGPVRVL